MTRVSKPDRGKKLISSPRGPDQPRISPILSFNSELLPRGKAVVLETDHSPPYNAEFKNMRSYISTPPPLHALMACTGTTLLLPLLFYFNTYLAGTRVSLNFYLTTVRGYRWQVGNYSYGCLSNPHQDMKDIICIQAEDSCCYNATYYHLRSRMAD
jgi:hypothetical protein